MNKFDEEELRKLNSPEYNRIHKEIRDDINKYSGLDSLLVMSVYLDRIDRAYQKGEITESEKLHLKIQANFIRK